MTLPDPSDFDCLKAFARTGDQGAFRSLTDRYAGLVFSAALRRTGQRMLAEEVSQNVFAVLARKAGALARPDVKLAAWLHRATVLEAARALRKESTRQRIMDDYFHQADVLSAEDAATWQAALPELDHALDALPARDRELLLARFFDDKSYRDLAAATGRSEAALMQQQHRALEKLGAHLRRRGMVVPMAVLTAALGTTLTQAAPAGLAASLAATAPAAAGSLGLGTLFWHSLDTFMQTKTRLTLAAAVAACFLGGTGAFFAAKSQAESRGESMLAAAAASTPRHPATRPPSSSPPSAAAAGAAVPIDLRAKLDQAVAGWRSNTDYRLRMKALDVLDALTPDEVPEALAYLQTLKGDDGLHLALGKRIATLWGTKEPQPALKWIVGELPREHRGDPMQAILTDWSGRDPQAALGWWQGVTDSLDFPIPEDAFERFETIIYTGWAAHDPASLIATLPEIKDLKEIEDHEDPVAIAKLMGLATAAVNPNTRAETLAAIAGISTDGTRAAAAGAAAMMMNISDASVGREFLTSLKFSDSRIRGDLLGQTTMMGVLMQQQEPAAAVAWLRKQTDEDTTRKAVEKFAKEHLDDDDTGLAVKLRDALDNR